MNELFIYSGIYLVSVFVASVSQVLLKKSAQRPHKNSLAEYLDPRVIVAYGLFFGASFITVMALKVVPVSMGTVLESSGYLYVTVLGAVFLKEKIGKRKLCGLGIILAGILIYAL